MTQFSGHVEARFTAPSGVTASASTGALTSAVTVTTPAANYFHTAAGGVSSWATAFQTQLNTNVRQYPDSASAMLAMLGYGTWTNGAGWLMQDASGSLAAAFGSPNLSAVSTPTYQNSGPATGKYAIGFNSASDAFSAGDAFDATDTQDLIVAWVGYLSSASGDRDMFSKYTAVAAAGWYIYQDNGNSRINFTLRNAGDRWDATTTGLTTGEWYVAIAVLDRSTGKARIATKGLTSGTSTIGSEVTVGAVTFANSVNLLVGDGAGEITGLGADSNLKMVALYIVSGSGVATGLSSNLATAITNFYNCIRSTWSVSLDTTGGTGRYTVSHSFWPAYVSWTSTAQRDLAGFEGDFNYPTTEDEMVAALAGYGIWENCGIWLCNEASGDLAPSLGSVTLADSGTVTYSNYGPRGAADKSVGFGAASDRFSGGDVFDIVSTEDLCVVWVGFHSSIAGARDMFSKIPSGGIGWAVYQASASTLGVAGYSGGSTASTCNALTNEWYVGVAVIDRAAAKVRIGIQGLRSGTQNIGSATTIAAITFANAGNFLVGDSFGGWTGSGTDTGFKLAYLGVTAGSAVAAGMSDNLAAIVTSLAAYMKSQTGTQQARGVWFPDCPLSLEGDPAQAPRVTDTRYTQSPTGAVLGLAGNSFYRHRAVMWTHVPIAQTWESEATYDNGSFETFALDAFYGMGHEWFTPASPVQIYWNDAGTPRALGYTFDDSTGVPGWYVVDISSTEPTKAAGDWTGLWRIEFGTLIAEGG